MMRFEAEPSGAFNVTEYGSVTNAGHFKALLAYSPYQNITDGVRYPDVLFTADVNDNRVGAGNSRKMAAHLQAAADPQTMVLLRVSTGVGHGIGGSLSAGLAQKADIWAFLFDRLKVPYDAHNGV